MKQRLTKGAVAPMILLLKTFGSETERSLILGNDSLTGLFKLESCSLKKSSGSESNLQQEIKIEITH